jgi:putative salt-induced outer membrane protein YdiY
MNERTALTRLASSLVLVVALAVTPVLAQEEAEEAPEPNWTNSLGLSYVGTSGNTDTTSFGLDFKSERRPTPWGLDLVATFTRAEDNGVVTAEQYLVGGRATRSLSERWSVFAGLSWARDTFGGFENRYIAEAGAEYLAIKTAKHTLSFDAGLTWTTEDQIRTDDVTGREYTESENWFGGVAGLKWEWAFSESASLSERVLYYPNFDTSSDWRVGSDTAVTADLTKLLALQFSYLVRYRNQPIDDREKTDTTTKVSVVMNF